MDAARAATLLMLVAYSAGAVPLVKNGKSDYSICIAPDAPPAERRAADELQRFLLEMSGARLPIVEQCDPARQKLVFVGASAALKKAAPGLDPDAAGGEGFILKTAGRHLIIAGGKPRGTMYGVYTFLDRQGCRWFTREVSRIPKRASIETGPLDERQRPAFEYREVFFTEALDKDWSARNRTNGNSAQLDASTGGKVQYYPFVHSFYELVPPQTYFKDHPEYFSLIDGARRTERGQLCLTNPDVLRLGVAKVNAWIREHPEATIISVSQNDWEGWCECDNCKRVEQEEGGAHSGPILRYVNALAEQVGREHPDKLIDTLAYWYSEDPPAKVRPRPNVRIRLCPIGVCESHAYEKCPRSAYFVKNLKAWSKITNQLYIWHYNTNFSHYLAPFPDLDEMAADVPLYQRNGVVGIFLEGSYAPGGGGASAELHAYVSARQLWDASTDVAQARDEFLEGVYGPAAASMRAYYDRLQQEARAQHMWIFNLPEFSPGFLAEAKQYLGQAQARAGTDEIRRRVKKASLPVEYVELVNAGEYDIRGGEFAPLDLDRLKKSWREFIAQLSTFGIQSIHEGRDLSSDAESAEALRAWRVVTLENEKWRLDLAPEMGGRVIRMIDKSKGRNLLRRAAAGEGGYPNLGGLYLSAYPDYVSYAWPVSWQLESSDAGSAVLTGNCPNGLILRRRVRLAGGSVVIESEARNASAVRLEAALQARADFDPGDIDAAQVSFRTLEGKQVSRNLIVPGEQPTGNVVWQGAEMPAGMWRVAGAETRFSPAQAARAAAGWTAKGRPRASLGIWSQRPTLQPGETIHLDVEYSAP
jgi:hypothetical protein